MQRCEAGGEWWRYFSPQKHEITAPLSFCLVQFLCIAARPGPPDRGDTAYIDKERVYTTASLSCIVLTEGPCVLIVIAGLGAEVVTTRSSRGDIRVAASIGAGTRGCAGNVNDPVPFVCGEMSQRPWGPHGADV